MANLMHQEIPIPDGYLGHSLESYGTLTFEKWKEWFRIYESIWKMKIVTKVKQPIQNSKLPRTILRCETDNCQNVKDQ